MRILHLSKFYPPDPGGLEQVVAALAEGAAARGHEVRVVAATGSSWVRDPGKRITEPPRNGVVVARVPTSRVVWSQPVCPGYLSASRWPADVMYLHRPHPLADLATLLGPRRPTIVLHHSDVQRQQVARWVYRPLARRVTKRADAVVVATRSHLLQAEDLGPAGRRKARAIPFGVDTKRFAPDPGARPLPLIPSRNGEPVGLFVGRLVGYKGLDVLVRALAGTDLRMVIAGDGPVRAELREQIQALGLSDRVVLAGTLGDDDVLALYQATDYFVLPSVTPAEMFGIVLVEAMACGRPVISTALESGVREVNEDGKTGLVVPPGDPDALRQAMLRLAGDAALRATLGAAARRRVEERFALDAMVDAHLQLCEELAAR